MEEKTKKNFKFLLALSIIIFGFFFLISARGFSDQGKYVEVKGLSEKIVKSDRAIWSMGYEVKSNDVGDLYATIERNNKSIEEFLVSRGFSKEEISVAPLNIYQDTYRDALFRYNANIQMSVYTEKVDLVKESSKEIISLIRKGVVINGGFINFEFSDLNSIKPEMLREAIDNAKISAKEFAENSGSRLGGISRANQGVFDISEKDPGSPEYKKVRVVSTIRFMLK